MGTGSFDFCSEWDGLEPSGGGEAPELAARISFKAALIALAIHLLLVLVPLTLACLPFLLADS